MTETARPNLRGPDLDRLRRFFWESAETIACALFRIILLVRARDMTEAVQTCSALVLAPHADDETLGCGGVIALKRRAGTRVEVLMVSDGSASHQHEPTRHTDTGALIELRREETRGACAVLGLAPEQLGFMDLPDGRLSDHVPRIADAIAGRLTAQPPDEVYVCALSDGHPDHVALAQAARQALAIVADRRITLWEYPVWSFDFRSWRHFGGTNTRGFLSGCRDMMRAGVTWRMSGVRLGGCRQVKAEALAMHRSQLGSYPFEPGWSGLPPRFLAHFSGQRELFREVQPDEEQVA